MASLSPWEHMGIGAIAGMTEVLVMQPTVGVKNALQEGRPIPWGQPTQLYRGLVVSTTLGNTVRAPGALWCFQPDANMEHAFLHSMLSTLSED